MTPKKILLFGEKKKIIPLIPYFGEIKNQKVKFFFYLSKKEKKCFNKEKNYIFKNKKLPNFYQNNRFKQCVLWFFLPYFNCKFFCFLAYKKFRKEISLVLLLSENEILLLAPILKLLKINHFYLVSPTQKSTKPISFFSKKIKSIESTTKTISIGVKLNINKKNNKNLYFPLPAGIKISDSTYQNNIFDTLAYTGQNKKIKFFTIGTIADLNNKQNIKILLQAAQKILTAIPWLQIIIIGEGKNRKKLSWLANKLGINTLTWFVGEQKNLKKWFTGFDVFFSPNKANDLSSVHLVLNAMLNKLPIITTQQDQFISLLNEKGIFYYDDQNSENLAQAIINLSRDRKMLQNIGEKNRQIVIKNHNIENIGKSLANILLKNNEKI